MGLILDTSVMIAGERRGDTVGRLLSRIKDAVGETEIAISTVSVVELTHGIYRAKTDADRERRRLFVEKLIRDLVIHPLTLEIARLAGQIEGEQAAIGNVIEFEDLTIGATALHSDSMWQR